MHDPIAGEVREPLVAVDEQQETLETMSSLESSIWVRFGSRIGFVSDGRG